MKHSVKKMQQNKQVQGKLQSNQNQNKPSQTRHFSPTSQPLIQQLLIDSPGSLISASHNRLYIKEVAQERYQQDDEGLKKL